MSGGSAAAFAGIPIGRSVAPGTIIAMDSGFVPIGVVLKAALTRARGAAYRRGRLRRP